MNNALLSSKNMCWCTPPDFFTELDREFHFELDPASTDKSAKCAKHFTPDDDGLKQDWGGYCVFCNPPYGRAIADWVRKGYEESRKPGTTVVMLIPSRTDTAYFHDWIFGKASEVRFLRGRLKFTDEDGNGEDAAPFPSAVIVWRSPESTGLSYSEALRKIGGDMLRSKQEKPAPLSLWPIRREPVRPNRAARRAAKRKGGRNGR